MTLMMELKEQRREGYDEGVIYGENRGRIETIQRNVRALIDETGWSTDKSFDVLHVSPEDRQVVMSQL
ncbi:MAG TPA: hypothetical protein DEP57_07490 [Selenomonas sp.]|nr:hypothetical protein [Selenomonas sp.]